MTVRFPSPLSRGQTIGITAPSSGLSNDAQRARLDLVIGHLRGLGFEVREGHCLRSDHKHVSAPTHARAAELMQMLLDPAVHAVIPPWGGELASELLEHLDFERLRAAPPKWVLGYSDTSTLLFSLALRAGWATAHGPCLMDLAPTQTDGLTWGSLAALQHDFAQPWVQASSDRHQTEWVPFEVQVDAPFKLANTTAWRRLDGNAGPISMQGRLIGGCIDTIAWLAGTSYGDLPRFVQQASSDGTIFYFENAEFSPPALKRCLLSLKRQGWFHDLAGVLVGRSTAPQPALASDLTAEEVISDVFANTDAPVLLDADIGHQPPQLTLVNGAFAKVMYEAGHARITQSSANSGNAA